MSDLLALDPQGMAEKLAYYDVMAQRTQLQSQQKLLAAQKTALKSLKSALTDFRTAMTDLNKLNSGMLQNGATVNNENFADITVSSNAATGNYSFHVDKLASAHQVALQDMTDEDLANDNGTLSLKIGDKQIDIDLSNINTMADLAGEINGHSDNPGAKASLVRTNGEVVMMLSSNESGVANKLEISGSSSAVNNATQTQIKEAADAEVWLGTKGSGLKLTNSSNTFNDIIEGVSIEFKQAHGENDQPLTVNVGTDTTATKEQINTFIDAYNSLIKELDGLTARGTGAFAGDSGINSLKNQMNNMIRTSFGDRQITEFGITASRDGNLTLDSTKLDKMLKESPGALSDLFNGNDGLLKSLDKGLDGFLSSTNGQIKMRQDNLDRRESQLTDRADNIEVRYTNSYNRYLTQFTQLQKVIGQMNSTLSMFTSITGS